MLCGSLRQTSKELAMDSPRIQNSDQQANARPPVTRIEKRTANGRVMVIFVERER